MTEFFCIAVLEIVLEIVLMIIYSNLEYLSDEIWSGETWRFWYSQGPQQASNLALLCSNYKVSPYPIQHYGACQNMHWNSLLSLPGDLREQTV